MPPPNKPELDGRKSRGDRSRAEVLRHGVELATIHGINGFSLASLAAASGISKAGIAGLFGPKDALQEAITSRARQVLDQRIFAPVRAEGRGLAQLEALGTTWIDYLADPKVRGGCFFAPAFFELDAQPGFLRDSIREDMNAWVGGIATIISDAQLNAEIISSANAEDEAFTFFSLGVTTNTAIQLGTTSAAGERAQRLWQNHIERLRTNEKNIP